MRIWFGLILTHIHKIALTYIIPFICPKLSLFSGFIPDQFHSSNAMRYIPAVPDIRMKGVSGKKHSA